MTSPGTGMWGSPLRELEKSLFQIHKGKNLKNLRKLTAEFLRKTFTSNFDNHWPASTASC